MTTLYIILWLLSGASSFIYWWTKENDFTIGPLVLSLFASLMGPFAFIVGYLIHGDTSKVLIKKRK